MAELVRDRDDANRDTVPGSDDATIPRRVLRITVDQQLRRIYANPWTTACKVTILTTGNPQVGLLHEGKDFDPNCFGVNDFNRLCPLPINQIVPFTLLPGEALFASCVEGKAHFTLLVAPPQG